MKINIHLAFAITLLFVFQNANAQSYYPDWPTPAEVIVKDKPFLVLQNEIETKLKDKDWAINKNTFLFYKDYPELNEVTRGASVHNFDLIIWGNHCEVSIKATSPLFTDYVSNHKVLRLFSSTSKAITSTSLPTMSSGRHMVIMGLSGMITSLSMT